MTFTLIVTEQTTALTDLVLAVVALVCAALLHMARRHDVWKVRLWTWVFILLAVAALLGTVAHGLDLTEQTRANVWRPLYLLLGLVVALLRWRRCATGGVRGTRAGWRRLPSGSASASSS